MFLFAYAHTSIFTYVYTPVDKSQPTLPRLRGGETNAEAQGQVSDHTGTSHDLAGYPLVN